MKKLINIKGIFTLIMLGIGAIFLISCGKQKNEKIRYYELKEGDFNTIEYVNENIDCGYKLLEEMDATEKSVEAPYTDISESGDVKSYGVYINEKNAALRTAIDIKNESESTIFGVTYGDKYGAARERIEDAGFELEEEELFNSDLTTITFKKGIVRICLQVKKEGEAGIEDDVIEVIGVSLPIMEEEK